MEAKVIWQQGMLLQPQHFQQQERYFESRLHALQRLTCTNSWGLIDYEINPELLKIGKFALINAEGIFPDGTWFKFDYKTEPALCLEINQDHRDQVIYLAAPIAMPSSHNIRYNSKLHLIKDHNNDLNHECEIALAELQPQLVLEQQNRNDFTCLALAKIADIRSNSEIILDQEFISPNLNIKKSPKLNTLTFELLNLLKHRSEMLSHRLKDMPIGDSAALNDLQLLQTLNRNEAIWQQLCQSTDAHPQQLHQSLLQLHYELATFTTATRRPITSYPYTHNNLVTSFNPLVMQLRHDFNLILEQRAKLIPLNYEANTWAGKLKEKGSELISYILAVYAENLPESLRANLPQQAKIAPITMLSNLISRALPGIPLQSLVTAPRQIPYHPNYCYFSLQKNHPLWNEFESASEIGIHISGELVGLQLELWAVKE